jgi:hypothetical protein
VNFLARSFFKKYFLKKLKFLNNFNILILKINGNAMLDEEKDT